MICADCDKRFDEAKEINTTYEIYYGIDENTRTPLILNVCPFCGSEDIREEKK